MIIIEEKIREEGTSCTPDASFILYSLIDLYLKNKYHVV
jgi:hypothetical protein